MQIGIEWLLFNEGEQFVSYSMTRTSYIW